MASLCNSCQKILLLYPRKWIRCQSCVSRRYRRYCMLRPVEVWTGEKVDTNDHWKKNLLINMTRFNLRKIESNCLAVEFTRRYVIDGLNAFIGSVLEQLIAEQLAEYCRCRCRCHCRCRSSCRCRCRSSCRCGCRSSCRCGCRSRCRCRCRSRCRCGCRCHCRCRCRSRCRCGCHCRHILTY